MLQMVFTALQNGISHQFYTVSLFECAGAPTKLLINSELKSNFTALFCCPLTHTHKLPQWLFNVFLAQASLPENVTLTNILRKNIPALKMSFLVSCAGKYLLILNL